MKTLIAIVLIMAAWPALVTALVLGLGIASGMLVP
jgi:hypothetical protein